MSAAGDALQPEHQAHEDPAVMNDAALEPAGGGGDHVVGGDLFNPAELQEAVRRSLADMDVEDHDHVTSGSSDKLDNSKIRAFIIN